MISKAQRDAEKFRQRTGSDWVDSRTITNCAECNDKFTVLNRKHHCRQCGQVICKKCSPERMNIGDENVRVCLSCSDDVSIHDGGGLANSTSSNDLSLRCFLCNDSALEKLSVLVEGRIKGQDLVYWHSACLKCCTCQKQLTFQETFLYPTIGNTEHQIPRCYCEIHATNVDTLSQNLENIESKELVRETVTESKPQTNQPSSPFDGSRPLRITYGPFVNTQYFLLFIPREKIIKAELKFRRSIPLVVILHGGFWKSKYSISNSCLDNLPKFFISAGIAVCLVEYRRVAAVNPDDQGGWPETGDDILLALESLHSEITRLNHETIDNPATRRPQIDLNRITLLGHSAGGQLALWACCEPQLSKLHFKPMMCVGIAPVANLVQGQQMRLSDEGDAIEKFLKFQYDPQNPAALHAYHSACPTKLLPLLVPTILVTGTNDTDVPSQLVEDFYWYAKKVIGDIMSRSMLLSSAAPAPPPASALPLPDAPNSEPSLSENCLQRFDRSIFEYIQAGPPPLKLLKLPGSTHYDVMDSTSNAWSSIFDEMMSMCPQLADVPELDLDYTDEQQELAHPNDRKKGESSDSLRIAPSSSPSSPARPSLARTPSKTLNSPTNSMVMGGPTPIKAVDYIWLSHAKSQSKTLKGSSFHSYGQENDDLRSDTSSDEEVAMPSRSTKSQPESPATKINSSRDSVASRDHQATSTTQEHSEFFSFPIPKSESSKSRFRFLF